MATKNEKYSAAEKRAYYRGQGFAAAKAGERVNVQGAKNKRSFLNGVSSQCEKMKNKRG